MTPHNTNERAIVVFASGPIACAVCAPRFADRRVVESEITRREPRGSVLTWSHRARKRRSEPPALMIIGTPTLAARARHQAMRQFERSVKRVVIRPDPKNGYVIELVVQLRARKLGASSVGATALMTKQTFPCTFLVRSFTLVAQTQGGFAMTWDTDDDEVCQCARCNPMAAERPPAAKSYLHFCRRKKHAALRKHYSTGTEVIGTRGLRPIF